MRRDRKLVFTLILGLLGASLRDAWADGGVVRLRETQGPFVVTVFTPSTLVQGLPTDVSVLVQDKDSNPILDANVNLTIDPPQAIEVKHTEAICGPSSENPLQKVTASHTLASNKLFYAATVQFPSQGDWQLTGSVSHGGQTATFACHLPIGSGAGGFMGVLPWLIVPPLAVALFVMNQILVKR